MRRVLTLIITVFVLLQGTGALAQRVTDSSFRTVAYIKSDGTVQDASYRTIGHAKDIPARWAAIYFFFRD